MFVFIKSMFTVEEICEEIEKNKAKLLLERAKPYPNLEFVEIYRKNLEFFTKVKLHALVAPNQEIDISKFR